MPSAANSETRTRPPAPGAKVTVGRTACSPPRPSGRGGRLSLIGATTTLTQGVATPTNTHVASLG